MINRQAEKKAAIISRLSGFRVLLFPASSPMHPRRHSHPEQHMCSIGEMLQVVTFGVFDAQEGVALEQ
ncbi:hypothetical protein [Pseudomonas sp. IT-P253]|jgi:hypothetical protein|uniref:hypothetical protein n=1 Tax=Pseudomonas sp. IT-P253 TaxID=3026455 RepID=UPI0039DFF860